MKEQQAEIKRHLASITQKATDLQHEIDWYSSYERLLSDLKAMDAKLEEELCFQEQCSQEREG